MAVLEFQHTWQKGLGGPELAQGVDMLGLEEGIIVTVHQAFSMDHSGIVHQDGDVTHLLSDSFGHLVHLFPVAHVTDEVVALCAHLPNLLCRLLEAFFSPPPENNLSGATLCELPSEVASDASPTAGDED